MKRFQQVTLNFVLLSLITAACVSSVIEVSPDREPTTQPTEPQPAAPAVSPFPSKPGSPENSGSVPELIIEKAKVDLMERLGIPKDQIRVTDGMAVQWPDASLGCPQPDIAYAQVTTPGYFILLEAGENIYAYHTNTEGFVILCQENSLHNFPVTPDDIDDGQPWMPVD